MRGLLLGALLTTALPGCGVLTADRPGVQQGNRLTDTDIEALDEGLSRARVRELIGTPVLQDAMHPDRWDYVYYRSEAGAAIDEPQRLTLFFDGDRLARIVDRYEPPDQPASGTPDVGPLPDVRQPAAPPGEPGRPRPPRPY